MTFEVLVSGESTFADDTLEWLTGHPSASVRNRHFGGKSQVRACEERKQAGENPGCIRPHTAKIGYTC